MIHLLLSLALSAQGASPPVAKTSSPPPMIVTHSVSQPPVQVVSTAPPPLVRIAPPPPVTLEIRVSGEDGLIWQGPLRVGGGAGATVSQSRAEAQPASCPPPQGYERSPESSFRLNLSVSEGQDSPQRYHLGIQWSRPGSPEGCIDSGSRTVQLQQTIALDGRQEAVLRGDAGLEIRLKRR